MRGKDGVEYNRWYSNFGADRWRNIWQTSLSENGGNIKIRDIFIIKEEKLPRNERKLGRVLDVCPDGDGLVRKAEIQIGNRKLGEKGKQLTNPPFPGCPIH